MEMQNNYDLPSVHYDDNRFSGTPRQDGLDKVRLSTLPTKQASKVTSFLAKQTESFTCRVLRGAVKLSNGLIKDAEKFETKLRKEKQLVAETTPRLSFRDIEWHTQPYLRLAERATAFVSHFDEATGLNFSRDMENAWNNWNQGVTDYTVRNIVDMARGGVQVVDHYYNNGLGQNVFSGNQRHLLPGIFLENENNHVQVDVVVGSNLKIASAKPRLPLQEFTELVGRGSWSAFNIKALSSMGIDGPNALSRIRTCDYSQMQSQLGKIVMNADPEQPPFLPKKAGLIYITAAGVKVYSYPITNEFIVSWAKGLDQRMLTKRKDGTMDDNELAYTNSLYYRLLGILG